MGLEKRNRMKLMIQTGRREYLDVLVLFCSLTFMILYGYVRFLVNLWSFITLIYLCFSIYVISEYKLFHKAWKALIFKLSKENCSLHIPILLFSHYFVGHLKSDYTGLGSQSGIKVSLT